MIMNVIMFGIAQEIFGKPTVEVEIGPPEHSTIGDLKSLLEKGKPALKGIGSYMIAVNNEYADDDLVIKAKDEIAVIPPVSGG